jgi:hypothetical protein
MRPNSLTCRILSLVSVVFGVAWSGPATADLVTDWNVQAFEIAAAAGTSSASLRARAVAMVHAAMHDALNAIEPRYSVYAVTAPASPQASPEAAVIGAATGVLSRLFPTQAALLDAARASVLAAIPDGDAKRSGLALGDQVAAEIIARRSEDKFEQYFRLEPYTPQPGPGAFQPPPPTPPATASVAAAPNIAQVTPFLLRSTAQFRAPGPPALTSEAYTRDFNEVKTIGAKDSPTRTAEQTAIAKFWEESNEWASWGRIARPIAQARGQSLWDNARLFTLLYMALTDTVIAVFETKYTYRFWRPVTAIRAADTDGNAATAADPAWEPLFTLARHPDYTSGSGGTCTVAATILASAFGEEVPFHTTSPTSDPAEAVREYRSFSHAAQECSDSRVWAGNHFRTAVQHGEVQGRQVAQWALEHFLRPVKTSQ